MSIRTVIDEFTATGNGQLGTALSTAGRLRGITWIIGVPDSSAEGDLDFDIQLSNGTWLTSFISFQTGTYAYHLASGTEVHLGEILAALSLPEETIIQAIRTRINIGSISAPIYVQIQAED